MICSVIGCFVLAEERIIRNIFLDFFFIWLIHKSVLNCWFLYWVQLEVFIFISTRWVILSLVFLKMPFIFRLWVYSRFFGWSMEIWLAFSHLWFALEIVLFVWWLIWEIYWTLIFKLLRAFFFFIIIIRQFIILFNSWFERRLLFIWKFAVGWRWIFKMTNLGPLDWSGWITILAGCEKFHGFRLVLSNFSFCLLLLLRFLLRYLLTFI